MQKLALMMAVMILGMSPAHGCCISVNPGSQGAGGQAVITLPSPVWSGGDEKILMTREKISQSQQRGAHLWSQGGTQLNKSCSRSN